MQDDEEIALLRYNRIISLFLVGGIGGELRGTPGENEENADATGVDNLETTRCIDSQRKNRICGTSVYLLSLGRYISGRFLISPKTSYLVILMGIHTLLGECTFPMGFPVNDECY